MTELSKIVCSLKKYKPTLKRKYKVKTIGIFGSFVRGEQKKGSDIDILVEFREAIGLIRFVSLEHKLSDRLGRKTDLVMKSSLKPAIGINILNEVKYI